MPNTITGVICILKWKFISCIKKIDPLLFSLGEKLPGIQKIQVELMCKTS